MKKFIVVAVLLGIVGLSFAQDLDTPTSGVAVPQAAAQDAGNSAIYDLIISKLHEMEQKYIARQVAEWEWIKWGYWIRAGRYPGEDRNADYHWARREEIHYEYWNQLSGAEFAAAKMEFNASWERIVAAGLN